MNAKNIINGYYNYKNSFNAAIRFVFDTAKETAAKVPTMPAKEDKSNEAKELRKNIKTIEKHNELITDCKSICDRFNITDVKSKNIPTYRNAILSCVPMLDINGNAVKLASLPAYMKNEITDYTTVFVISECTWIETICAATENVDGKQAKEYNITIAPIIENGEVIESACGDIVNAKGEKIDADKLNEILAKWNNIAKINNIANAAGNEVKKATIAELKANK